MNQFGSDKILKHLERVAEWQKTGISRPITYELDMTNICNSKCPYCFGFNSDKESRASLTLKEAKNIIAQIKSYGGKGITFTGGGDPLCNKATLEAVSFAKKIGLDIGFITNGILLNDRDIDCLVNNCTWIRISLDAGTPQSYRTTHGMNGDTFHKVVSNLKKMTSVKKKRCLPVTIGAGFLTFEATSADMERFVLISRKAGVDYAQFRPLLKKPGHREINNRSNAEILKNIEHCMRYSNSKFKVLCSVHKYESMKNKTTLREYGECYGHNFAAVVSANKKMYICCHMRGIDKYCIGDLGKDSLKVIWRSQKRKKAVRGISFADCPLLCRCDGFNTMLWNICGRSEHVNFL